MRDQAICEPPVYKEVVVIGNGPGGLTLSYVLSGHRPHLTGGPHPDEMLRMRLSGAQGRSVLQEDLERLSEGLQGRSRNPVAMLFDALLQPGADQGLDYIPPLIDWKPSHSSSLVDHVIIGRGPPGGAWTSMDPNVLTLSLSSWMELPGMRFGDWESGREGRPGESEGPRRVRASTVAAYYTDYVHNHRLGRFLRRGSIHSVRHNSEGSVIEGLQTPKGPTWTVEGTDSAGHGFTYICRYLVLATGTTDRANRLKVQGEGNCWVHHDLRALEAAMEDLAAKQKNGNVLIVGAGLSAADAILSARFHNLEVHHIFRKSPNDNKALPPSIYPEYHKVHQMMEAIGAGYPGYTAYPGFTIAGFDDGNSKSVSLISPDGKPSEVEVDIAGVLIGSSPDLSFLPPEFNNGMALAVNPKQEIDSRSNPLRVDGLTHEVRDNLYAIGPLAGDNFVRFIVGGALAAAGSISTKSENVT